MDHVIVVCVSDGEILIPYRAHLNADLEDVAGKWLVERQDELSVHDNHANLVMSDVGDSEFRFEDQNEYLDSTVTFIPVA